MNNGHQPVSFIEHFSIFQLMILVLNPTNLLISAQYIADDSVENLTSKEADISFRS